jgi:hypothetical protein
MAANIVKGPQLLILISHQNDILTPYIDALEMSSIRKIVWTSDIDPHSGKELFLLSSKDRRIAINKAWKRLGKRGSCHCIIYFWQGKDSQPTIDQN